MFRHLALCLPVLSLSALLANCAPTGSCAASSGTVNTYTVFGKWKMISPYSPARSDAVLQYNYNLLIVEKGASICQGQIVNGAVGPTVFQATYTNDMVNKQVVIDYLTGTRSGEDTATYSFSGSCDATEMTLHYAGGTTEVYELYNKSVNQGDCGTTQ